MSIRTLNTFAIGLACCGFFAVSESEAQGCYRMRCSATNTCESYQEQPSQSGPCCCKVECQGGPQGPTCTCTTWCTTNCSLPCPSCSHCTEQLAAGEQGFVLTPQAHKQVSKQDPLVAMILGNLSNGLSSPVYSGIAEGNSNVDTYYDYSYNVRITATRARVMMELVTFHPMDWPVREPMRVTIDEFGNVATTLLLPEEVKKVREEAVATCVERTLAGKSESNSRVAEEG